MSDSTQSLSYRDAGVDIDAGNALIDKIKPLSKATYRDGVMGGLGGFGALFEIPLDRYKKPVLVSGTDGVGAALQPSMPNVSCTLSKVLGTREDVGSFFLPDRARDCGWSESEGYEEGQG